jgi:homoserine kinase type II
MGRTFDIKPVLDRFSAADHASQIEPLGAAGGMSGAQFWRVTNPQGALALRRWPAEHPTADRLRFIHAVLRYAHKRGCSFLPVPVNDRSGETFVEHAGRLWELSPWMPGEADFERSPSPAKLAAALAALGRFHKATADFPLPPMSHDLGAPTAVTKRLARLHELQTGGIATLDRAIVEPVWPELAPLARQFLALLPNAVPRVLTLFEPLAGAALPVQPCLRDIWHDHVLFTGDKVTGVIDFGGVDVDTPATDVARLVGSLVGDDAAGWRAGVAAYTEVRPLSDAEARAVVALDAAGTVLAGCNWIRWIYADRRTFENREQVLARFKRILARVARHSAP